MRRLVTWVLASLIVAIGGSEEEDEFDGPETFDGTLR